MASPASGLEQPRQPSTKEVVEMGPQAAALLRRLETRMDQMESLMSSLKVQGDLPASLPGQYPGKPIPHTEGVEIDVAANTNSQQGNITISADGPFLAQRVHFAWRQTEDEQAATYNIWRPICSVDDLAGNVGVDIINFYWEYQVSGSHRNRQNIPVPSASVWRAEEGNGAWELYVQDVFGPTSTITMKVTPTVAPSHYGVLYVGFHGCYMLE